MTTVWATFLFTPSYHMFICVYSGSTGTPKGVLHTQAGYMLYAATTHKYTFDYHVGEVYWCTADVGWITGHTYVAYGPLANGATSVIVSTNYCKYNCLLVSYKLKKQSSRHQRKH